MSSFNSLGPQSSTVEVFRTNYVELSLLVSDSGNRLPLPPELFSACLITIIIIISVLTVQQITDNG